MPVDYYDWRRVVRGCEILSVLQSRLSHAHLSIQKPYCIASLGKLLSEAPLLIQLMTDLRPKSFDTPSRATKRAKVTE